MDEASTFITVFVSGNWVEAYMVACALEGHEIESLILDDNICRISPGFAFLVAGVKVLTDERDRESALEVIRLVFPGEAPSGTFVNVGIGGSDLGLLLALPWILRRRRAARASVDDASESII